MSSMLSGISRFAPPVRLFIRVIIAMYFLLTPVNLFLHCLWVRSYPLPATRQDASRLVLEYSRQHTQVEGCKNGALFCSWSQLNGDAPFNKRICLTGLNMVLNNFISSLCSQCPGCLLHRCMNKHEVRTPLVIHLMPICNGLLYYLYA
jgi:hypothetical protein